MYVKMYGARIETPNLGFLSGLRGTRQVSWKMGPKPPVSVSLLRPARTEGPQLVIHRPEQLPIWLFP